MSFKDIKGQDKPIERLIKYISEGCLPQAFIFVGPEGVGKSLVAKILAKAVNCLNLKNDSCDGCLSCVKIEKQGHPDVHILDYADSEIKIEYIRQLQQDINLKPYEAKKKVFIINNAHNLNPESSNAFLKTLEEPPASSLIILVTSKPSLLFKTVISRCQAIKFQPLKRADLKEILKESHCLDDKACHYLAYFSEGRMGLALRLNHAGILNEKNTIINEFMLSRQKPSNNWTKENFKASLNILSGWFRDIYFLKTGMPAAELINLDRKDDLLKLVDRYSFSGLDRILGIISDTFLHIEQNVNIKLLVSNIKAELWKN
jgi:DNA polymerase-3 subunit delta'